MFDSLFPKHWSTLKKLIYLRTAQGGGGGGSVWKTVTGALLHITDALASPVKALSVAIEPLQSGSGDPSPTNVRPITGWTGCNIEQVCAKSLIAYAPVYTLTKTRPNGDSIVGYNYTNTYVYPIPKGTLYIRKTNDYAVYYAFGNTKEIAKGDTVYDYGSINASGLIGSYVNTQYKYIYMTLLGTGAQYIGIYPESTSLQPETGEHTTYPISWQTEAGTVYGGTLDVVNGTLTVYSVNLICDPSKFYTLSNVTTSNEIQRFTVKYPLPYTGNVSSAYSKYRACNVLPYKTGWENFEAHIYVDSQFAVFLPTSYATISNKNLTAWQNWLNSLSEPLQIVYPLATPLEYQLTPQQITTLAGENNIWADVNGEITLTYKSNGNDSDIVGTGKADFMILQS